MPQAASGQFRALLKRSKEHPSVSMKAPKVTSENNGEGTWKMNKKACRLYVVEVRTWRQAVQRCHALLFCVLHEEHKQKSDVVISITEKGY
jgi:hypothetical protein